MIGSLPLGFAQPLVLLGLLSLPLLWWMLRLVPPRPRRINFPPTRLLFEIAPKEETPSRTPWWLTLLRLRPAALLALSEPARDISMQVAGAARVQIKQLKPKPYTVDRGEALPLLKRFLAGAPNVEVVWLSDGVDLGKGAAFIEGLKQVIGDHPLTVVNGGLGAAHALAAADNAAGALTVKVLRAQTGAA